jgi:hypothetical protein
MASRKAQNDAATRFKSLYAHGFVRVAALRARRRAR